jgi:hypothetical protein
MLPIVEPNTQAFLDSLAAKGGAPLEQLSVEEGKKPLEVKPSM